MRSPRMIPVTLAMLTAAMFTAAPADAAHFVRPHRFSFVATGQIGGGDTGVAVDQATGDVYITSQYGGGGAVVSKFSASGVPESFNSPHLSPSGSPIGVAVDNSGGPSEGDVYVTQATEGRVLKLEASGGEAAGFTPISASSIPPGDPGSEGLLATGVAVDPANGDVVVADFESGEVDIFSESGVFVSQFKGEESGPFGVAVGSGSTIFTGGGRGVQEWSPSDKYSTPTTIDPSNSFTVAVDLATGNVLADEESKIAEYDSLGNPLLRFDAGESLGSWGVGVDEKTNTVYVTEKGGSEQVNVYGPPIMLADVVTGTLATGVTSTTASVSGNVNPSETTVTECRFEYGPSTSYGTTSPCSALPPLTGNAPIPEAANLVGLQPNTTYHYRLVAVGANGPSYGEDETFETPPATPALDNQSISALTQTTVTLNASINPNNQETTYQFEFGTSTGYGTTLPSPAAGIGSGYGDVVVGQQLSGLNPGTTYHFRVTATNATGTSTGTDQTFTTPPPTPPIVSTGAASGISSSAAMISGSVDPQGVQSTYEFDLGVDTGYGTRIFGEAGSGTEPRSFSVSLDELTPNTTYHYRLVAANSFGTSYGPDETFTTPVVPGALLSGPAGAPLIPAPPFPEQATTATSTAQYATAAQTSATAAKVSRSKRAGAGRLARRHGKRGSEARRSVRTGHVHDNGRGGR